MQSQFDSPHFSRLISWLKEQNLQELRKFFPLRDMDTLIRRKYRSKYYSKVNLAKLRSEIYSELIDPLFIRPRINVKDLSDCFEAFLKELKQKSHNKFEYILKKFHLNYNKIAPRTLFPFSWMFETQKLGPEEEPMYRLRQRWERLNEDLEKIEKARERFFEEYMDKIYEYKSGLGYKPRAGIIQKKTNEYRRPVNQIENIREKTDKEIEANKEKILGTERVQYSITQKPKIATELSGRILNWLKIARGKPGRHPKPFNVYAFHLIIKCTHPKRDENRKPFYLEDGQYKLERDWKLILFLILNIHLHKVELPELVEFITKNEKKPAHEALKILKEKLWNTYKNFPPLDGWSFERKIAETGFRKLTVGDDGRLHIIRL